MGAFDVMFMGERIHTAEGEASAAGYVADCVSEALPGSDESDEENYSIEEVDAICPRCNGSGEGMADGTRCSACGGSGDANHTWGYARRSHRYDMSEPYDDYEPEPDHYPEVDW